MFPARDQRTVIAQHAIRYACLGDIQKKLCCINQPAFRSDDALPFVEVHQLHEVSAERLRIHREVPGRCWKQSHRLPKRTECVHVAA